MCGRCGAGGRVFVVLLIAIGLPIGGARGSEFKLRYDADMSFPEEAGWQRRLQDPNGESVRKLDDSVFWLDTRASLSTYDFYMLHDPGFEPGIGETLEVRWPMCPLESYSADGFGDVKVGVCSSAQDYVSFSLWPDHVVERGDGTPWVPEHSVPIEPGVFHDYSVRTTDFHTYSFYLDGQFAFSDDFGDQFWTPGPFVAFGDAVLGASSLSAWDYLEVRVVPQPQTVWAILVLSLVVRRRSFSGGPAVSMRIGVVGRHVPAGSHNDRN